MTELYIPPWLVREPEEEPGDSAWNAYNEPPVERALNVLQVNAWAMAMLHSESMHKQFESLVEDYCGGPRAGKQGRFFWPHMTQAFWADKPLSDLHAVVGEYLDRMTLPWVTATSHENAVKIAKEQSSLFGVIDEVMHGKVYVP